MTHTEATTNAPGDRLYAAVYRALLFGMTVSNLLFIAGILLDLAFRGLAGQAAAGTTPLAAFSPQLLLSGNPLPLYAWATVILILTPIARVTVSIVAFLLDRDYRFALVASLVLAIFLLAIVTEIKRGG